MEQCVSRPPEKVLIMPNTSSTAVTEKVPNQSTTGGKKPARASLLSIISGDKKSPSPSVSSPNEELPSPATPKSSTVEVRSPTSSLTSPTELTATETGVSTAKPTKKKPPPTLAKTFRTSLSPTSPKAAPLQANLFEVSSSTPKEDTTDQSSAIGETSVTAAEVIHDNSVAGESNCTDSVSTTLSSPAATVTPVNSDKGSDVEISDNKTVESTAMEETITPVSLPATESSNVAAKSVLNDTADQPTTIELPPPALPEPLPEADEGENMEFPPPPEVDFVTDVELTTDVDNSQVENAVEKITSKYDVSYVAVNNIHSNNSATGEADLELSKHNLSTKDLNDDSVNIPSHNLNHTGAVSSDSSDNTKLVTVEVHSEKAGLSIAEVSSDPEQLNRSQIAKTEQDTATLETNISSPLNDSDTTDSHVSHLDKPNSGETTMPAADDPGAISDFLSPPAPPQTSTHTALDTSANISNSQAPLDLPTIKNNYTSSTIGKHWFLYRPYCCLLLILT